MGRGEPADHLERVTDRYLDLLRDALLGEHYLENEMRIEHLLDVVGGADLDLDKLADPARHDASRLRRLKRERRVGELAGDGAPRDRAGIPASAALGRVRLDHLRGCLEALRNDAVEGDLIESGTGRGGAAIFMRGFLEAHEIAGSRVWVVDRFDGRELPDGEDDVRFPPVLNSVREGFARFDLLDDRVKFLQGPPASELGHSSIDEVALLRVDSIDPEEVRAILEAIYERVSPGGFVVIDDYGSAGCQEAVEAFRADIGVQEPLERIDWSAAAWRRAATGRGPRQRGRVASGGAGANAIVDPTRVRDLSVVVVVHDMLREARRTLHSLSRSYQEGVEDLDYEVIVVENGSAPEQRLGEELVQSFGEEFCYIDLGEEALLSPAAAINRGIAASSAPNVALMIDGAHLLTPGVLRYGMLGLHAYRPAIVSAKQWYVGPGQQPQTVASGYDKGFEDRLLAAIEWPVDGYRLFEISHFIGDRDWFDGEWESNCIFVPRALLDQVGGMDESFDLPGGGFVNLDFFERMVGTPGVSLVTMLGEGSFHQVHGGTTTNAVEPHELISSYDDDYAELRGRRFHVPPQWTHYVGTLRAAARRTKPRRMKGFRHFSEAGGSRPTPMPQDLKTEFIDAFWRSGEWHRTPWLGRPTHRPPTDLLVYQELIDRIRPDWIVETRTGAGGRALFLASICDLVDGGQVLSIDGYPLAEPPAHLRITYLRGDPAAESTAARAREIVGERPQGIVILGGGDRGQVVRAFHNYAPFVPVGSYVIVEDTILEGNPVWPDFGSGPAAALRKIIGEGDFVAEPWAERFGLTFNAGGFLKRVR